MNKVHSSIKEMILASLNQAGGQDYLARQAEESPAAFLGLLGKVLPLQLTGEEGGAIEMIVTGVRRAHEIEAGEFELETEPERPQIGFSDEQ